jgi:hypothetical protein
MERSVPLLWNNLLDEYRTLCPITMEQPVPLLWGASFDEYGTNRSIGLAALNIGQS